jgi:hypothetical protein
MKPKSIYLVLCVVGAVLPYWQFGSWLIGHGGLDMPAFLSELFANRISAFAWMDVLVSAMGLVVFMRVEGARVRVPLRWLPLGALLLVGVSLALPLYLYLRETALEQRKTLTTNA